MLRQKATLVWLSDLLVYSRIAFPFALCPTLCISLPPTHSLPLSRSRSTALCVCAINWQLNLQKHDKTSDMPMRPRTPFATLPQRICYLCLYLYLIYLGQASISSYLTQQQYKQQQQQQQIQPNVLGCEIAFRFIFIRLPSCEHCDKLVLTFFSSYIVIIYCCCCSVFVELCKFV